MQKCKTIIWLMMLAMTIQLASAIEMCEDKKEINENCTMVTADMGGCVSYTYDIKNISSNGVIVESGNLIDFGDNIYAFNFTQPEGDYVIKLCDGTTREMKVRLKDNTMIAISIILIGLICILAYFAKNLSDDNKIFMWLKLLFFGLSMFFLTMLTSFGKIMLENSGGSASMISLLSTAYRVMVIISWLSITLILVSFLIYTLKGFSDVKKEKDIEKYGKE